MANIKVSGPDPKETNPNTGKWSLWRGTVHVAEYLTYVDAVLFAAAPDLLEALDDLVNGPFPAQDFEAENLYAKARAAIAKATGA